MAVLIAVYAKLYPLRDQFNEEYNNWHISDWLRFLSLINNIRSIASTDAAFLEILQYINVGHAIPAIGKQQHECEGLVMQFYIECFMQMPTFPSRYDLLRFFICLNTTQLCHYAGIEPNPRSHS